MTRADGGIDDSSTRRSTCGDAERKSPGAISRASSPSFVSLNRIHPRSGSTGPPIHNGRSLPATTGGASCTTDAAANSVGRLMIRPKAPSAANSHSRTTVRPKLGSSSCGIESSSDGVMFVSSAMFQRRLEISTQALDTCALHRAALHCGPQFVVGARGELGDGHGGPGLTLLPCRVVAHGRATVPGADVLTDIAPIHMMTDCGGACSRQIAAMLDRQVRQTPPRVELIGLDDGAGRTGLDAG